METRILNDLSVKGGQLIMAKALTDFPANPAVGTFIVKDECLYCYIKIGTLKTWYPFGARTNSYVHVQGLANTTWTVNHNLGTADVWFQIKDSNNKIIYADTTTIDANSFTVNLTTAESGTVVVVAPDTLSVPEIKAGSISVNDGYVVIDSTGVKIDGVYALTSGNLQTFIDVEVTARMLADTTIQSQINLMETKVAVAASDIDMDTGSVFTKTISAETTFTVSNVPASGTVGSFVIELTNGGSATVNWWSGMKWVGGTPPTLTASGKDMLAFITHDGGTTWTGLVCGLDIK